METDFGTEHTILSISVEIISGNDHINMLLTILTFIIILSMLVLAHEFGHFIVAKKTGIKVEEFAIGFPPRVWSKKIGDTAYSINAIPLGGYVKMLGEVEKSNDPRAFENQSRGVRFSVAIAGVTMNLVLAWFILALGFSLGMSPIVSDYRDIPGEVITSEIIVANVLPGSAAEKYGIQQMDKIQSMIFDNQTYKFGSVEDMSKFTRSHQGNTITVNLFRGSEEISQEVILGEGEISPFGVSAVNNAVVRVPWYRTPYVALRETYEITRYTAVFIGELFSKIFVDDQVKEQVGGPVQIYLATGTAVKIGFVAVLQLIAILSVNLAIINILPLPALDGGRILFIIIEAIARKRIIKEKVESVIHAIGFALLMGIIVLVTYNDVAKIIAK